MRLAGYVLFYAARSLALDATWLSSASRTGGEYVRVRVCGTGLLGDLPACFVTVTPEGDAPSLVTPIPIAPESRTSMQSEQSGLGTGASIVVDRDGGLFDNTPWERLTVTKRDFYDRVKYNSGRQTPYGRVVSALGTSVIETMVEDAWPLDDRVVFAGVVRLASPSDGDDTIVVDCLADEALGLALADNCPLLMPTATWAATATLYRLGPNGELVVENVPTRDRDSSAAIVPLDQAISSAQEYLAMSAKERLRLIVAAGLEPPRPRVVNNDAIDAIILPRVDEIIRREVLMERALAVGDIKRANELAAAKSERHRAYDEIREASDWEDLGAEAGARARKMVLDATRADPTQDPGSYDPFLDRDEWYEEQRRRLMGSP